MLIRPWQPNDVIELSSLIQAFLQDGERHGSDLLCTQRNVGTLWRLGLEFALAGDPSLVAIDSSGSIIGYIEWGRPVGANSFDCRRNLVHAFGAYVVPEERHGGVNIALRDRGCEIAKAKGYDAVTGPVSVKNEKGAKHFHQTGSNLAAWQFEFSLR